MQDTDTIIYHEGHCFYQPLDWKCTKPLQFLSFTLNIGSVGVDRAFDLCWIWRINPKIYVISSKPFASKKISCKSKQVRNNAMQKSCTKLGVSLLGSAVDHMELDVLQF